MENLETKFRVCRSLLSAEEWKRAAGACSGGDESFPACLAGRAGEPGLPAFLPDLALLELAVRQAQEQQLPDAAGITDIAVNPTLQVVPVGWKGLTGYFAEEGGEEGPEEGEELVAVWKDPLAKKVRVRVPTDLDLLALKVLVEEIDADQAAADAGKPVGVADVAVSAAVRKGLLLSPPSKIRRDPDAWPASGGFDEGFLVSRGFTLQWHITQACDLHCRHCYDRSSRARIPLDKALAVLDDFRGFCRRRFVGGHVSLTGGNPLLHPDFFELYRAVSERGFTVSILGNPAPREQIEEIVSIERPYLYQVSLEGLEGHNDAIRGKGHFRSVMDFLALLKEMEVSSMVMLTLTEGNIDQVLPLAELLEGLADDFTFNRLSMVGEGAGLRIASPERYEAFLEEYTARAERSSLIGLKDNLINILRLRRGEKPFGGCTGFGCGAAFNFISVLAEGEAHACRKFPSPIGNVLTDGIEGVYESEAARRYRAGCEACRECEIRPVCGGCLAVAYGCGLDPLRERDPQCFMGGTD
jgi:selenobiotic family peptide radical SAM maturase